MISFPWRTFAAVERDGEYVALLGVERLSHVRLLPTFIHFGVRIGGQLKRTPGALGYRAGATIGTLAFYHLSAWTDAAAIEKFVGTAPHQSAVDRLSGRLGETAFRYWTVRGGDLPLHFARELHRL